MSAALITEKPLVFSPVLAATIGLEEAVLLSVLHDISLCSAATDQRWHAIAPAQLAVLLPFWPPADIQRISRSLAAQGILLLDSPQFDGRDALRFCLQQPAAGTVPDTPSAPPAAGGRPIASGQIPSDWQPSADVCRQLALQNIPQAFIARQVPEFVLYWRARDSGGVYSWEARFYRQVVRAWRDEEVRFPIQVPEPARPIPPDWQPDTEAVTILMKGGTPGDFIEEAVPEFVLYWRERGDNGNTWNSKFVQHVRRQWLRCTESLAGEREARRMTDDWQPSADVFDILAMATIDAVFARDLVAEFVLYWKDSGEAHPSWNSKFLRHVKHRWAQHTQAEKSYAEQFIDTVTDTSWADHL